MKKFGFILSSIILLLTSCSDSEQFKVKGNISEAEGSMLYLEHVDVLGNIPLDSTRLNAHGNFNFAVNKYNSPEFFRLRVNNKFVNFVIDSTETVQINGDYTKLEKEYEISQSEDNEKIKELSLKLNGLQADIDKLMKKAIDKEMPVTVFNDSVANMMQHFKDNVKFNYIFKAPNKLYSYFALFMRVNDFLMFDPYNNKDDIKCFAAVATSMEQKYPHSDRTKHLTNITLRGMKNTRNKEGKTLYIPEEKYSETGIIDISLNDANGNTVKLSSLKGKVVILDFMVHQSTISVGHNLFLRELYDKYKDKGLEIYQVSLDADEHYWRQTTINLPWICVRDQNGVYSPLVESYNIQAIPTIYLVDRNSNLDTKVTEMESVETRILQLLK